MFAKLMVDSKSTSYTPKHTSKIKPGITFKIGFQALANREGYYSNSNYVAALHTHTRRCRA